MKIKCLFRIVGFNLLSALSLTALLAVAQEMPSRYKAFDSVEVPTATMRLRSSNAPTHRVALAPTKQAMQEAAASAKGLSKEKSVSVLIGPDAEPPVAPYYVGPVFESGMAATRLVWQAVAGGNITHVTVSSEGAKGIRAKLLLPRGLSFGEIRVAASLAGVAEALPLNLAQDGVLWTPYTEGGSQVIEIFTPQKVSDVSIQVVSVSHFIESLAAGTYAKPPGEASVPTAGSCTIDVVCPSTWHADQFQYFPRAVFSDRQSLHFNHCRGRQRVDRVVS